LISNDDDYILALKIAEQEKILISKDEVNEDEDYLFALKIQKEYEDYLVALKAQKEDEDYLVALKIQKEDKDYLLALKTEKEEIKEEEKQKEQDIKYAQQLEAAEHERRQKKIEEIVSKNSFGREPEQLTKLRYSLDEFLDKTASNGIIEEVITNKHAHPESPSELYDKFVGAWADVHENHKHSLLLCYHGTKEENLENICEYGLDPKRRLGQAFGKGEYFGTKIEVSFPYCKKPYNESVKLIVFAILCAPEGLTHRTDDVLVVHENSFQLPLYVIKLKLKAQYQQQYQIQPALQLNSINQMLENSRGKRRKRRKL
jgi:hypothetical protein